MMNSNRGSALRSVITLGVLAFPAVSFAATAESRECSVPFSTGSSMAADAAINECIDSFKGLKLTRIEVMGFATPGGSRASNARLSQKRANTIRNALMRAYPTTEVIAKGKGSDAARGMSAVAVASYAVGTEVGARAGSAPASELGQTSPHSATTATDPYTGARLVDESSQSTAGITSETPASQIKSFPARGTLRSNQQPAPIVTGDVSNGDAVFTTTDSTQVAALDSAAATQAASNEKAASVQRENIRSGWNDIRLAARLGYDKVWDRQEYMNALGADVSYVRRNVGTTLARVEAGATASFLGDFAEDNKNFNFHGTLFPALEVGPLVVGPRGLIGGVWNDTDKNVQFDAGGEGRLGLESSNYSVFFSAGRTMELTRVAVDLGATF